MTHVGWRALLRRPLLPRLSRVRVHERDFAICRRAVRADACRYPAVYGTACAPSPRTSLWRILLP